MIPRKVRLGRLGRFALLAALSIPTSALAQTGDQRDLRSERRAMTAADLDRESLNAEYERMARQKRHEEIQFARELLDRQSVRGETRAELMLRLADLYFEEGRYHYLMEMAGWEERLNACYDDETCDPDGVLPDHTESAKWQRRSISTYEGLLREYPTFHRADEAVYFMASALQDMGEARRALREFTRLVKTYPESEFVPDAYVMVGEHYFEQEGNAFKAMLAYQKAAAYRSSPRYPFALYKLAWCYFNVGEYEQGLDTMKAVVAHGESESGGLQLRDEALKDMVLFFATLGDADGARIYYSKLGKDDLYYSMLRRLAGIQVDHGDFEESVRTWRWLIAEDSLSPSAPSFQHEIVQTWLRLDRKDDTLAELDRLIKTYGPGSAWARHNADDADALAEASEHIESDLRKVAQSFHQNARKTGDRDAWLAAYKTYAVYVDLHEGGEHLYEMRYSFGELLYDIKKYDEAWAQYTAVVEMDPKGRHAEFCAEGAIFAADEMVKREGASQQAGPGGLEPIALTDWEEKKLSSMDRYSELFPDAEKTNGVIYESGYLLYHRNHFKRASDRFRVVIAREPGSRRAEQAANLILDSFNLVEDWASLQEVAKEFYDQEGLGSASFKTELFGVYERASFKRIEVELGDSDRAADALLAFVEEFPESEVGDLALNNAAVYYHAHGRVEDAMTARHALIDRYPKSDHYHDQIAALGYDYESIADFARAADWYERLLALAPDHEASGDAIYSAGLFREALGEWEAAIKDYERYMAGWPERADVPALRLRIGQLYEEQGRAADAANVYALAFRDAEPGPVQMVARLRYGQALLSEGRIAEALQHYEASLELPAGDGPQDLEIRAEMMFQIAADRFADFEEMRIDGPGRAVSPREEDRILTEQLTAKTTALLEMEQIYGQIVQTGAGEWGLAAVVELGRAYEDNALAIRESHVPSYLTPEQAEFYVQAMIDRADMQHLKAISAYEVAASRAFELMLYNDNTAFAARRLGELAPEDHPPFHETVSAPGYTSASPLALGFATEM